MILTRKKLNMAPIVLFVFNRPHHTRQTVNSLKANLLAEQTDLIVFSDGPRNFADEVLISEVRHVIASITGFKSIKLIERETNYGLAHSIENGITAVLKTYGSVIVLEDDMVVHRLFITYMNRLLEYYEKEEKIWHINGYMYPIQPQQNFEIFLLRIMSCWGWATWRDRWAKYRKDPLHLKQRMDREKILKFDLDGYVPYWSQVIDNLNGRADTWAVFWYATIFEHNGLCVSPSHSLVSNVGLDGTGTNCGIRFFKVRENLLPENFQELANVKLPSVFEESGEYVELIKRCFKFDRLVRRFLRTPYHKIKNFMKK